MEAQMNQNKYYGNREGFNDPEQQRNVASQFGSSFSEKVVRMAFIRKVYAILTVQLAITAGFICLFIFCKPVKKFVMEHPEMLIVAFIMIIVLMVAIVCFDSVRRTFPLNLICLFLFTLVESFFLGVISSSYSVDEVLLAVGICAVVCLALTIFAFQTKIDFTMRGGMLFVLLVILFAFGFLLIFLHNEILRLIYASLGAFVFSLYLVYDTQLLIGGQHKYSISPEEYIFAALSLYVDIINLFLFILQIIGSQNRN